MREELRLVPGSPPEALTQALAAVRARLGLRCEVEVYHSAGPPGARVMAEGNTALLSLSGPVFSLLEPSELAGLLGHALGDFALHLAPGAPFRDAVRVARLWSMSEASGLEEPKRLRAAALLVACELSADRAGLLCAGGLRPYARAWLKLGTELGDEVLRHDVEAYLEQVREALEESTGAKHRGVVHAERHVRVRAAELFAGSKLFRALLHRRSRGRGIDEVNAETGRLLAGWVPRGASSIEPERFQHFLLAAATAVASADGTFCMQEREFLSMTLPQAFRGRLPSPDEASRALDGFAKMLRSTSDERAMLSTLHLLCGLVDADGHARACELAAIDAVGKAIGARELFRRELAARYGFDPRAYSPGLSDKPRVPRKRVPPQLLRYLSTVELVGSRSIALRKLLRLSGAPRRTPRAMARLETLLSARDIEASPALSALPLDAEVSLRFVGQRRR